MLLNDVEKKCNFFKIQINYLTKKIKKSIYNKMKKHTHFKAHCVYIIIKKRKKVEPTKM